MVLAAACASTVPMSTVWCSSGAEDIPERRRRDSASCVVKDVRSDLWQHDGMPKYAHARERCTLGPVRGT